MYDVYDDDYGTHLINELLKQLPELYKEKGWEAFVGAEIMVNDCMSILTAWILCRQRWTRLEKLDKIREYKKKVYSATEKLTDRSSFWKFIAGLFGYDANLEQMKWLGMITQSFDDAEKLLQNFNDRIAYPMPQHQNGS